MSNQDGRLLNPLSRRSYEKIGDCERSALSISYDSWISLRASSPGRCGGGALPFSTPRPPPPLREPWDSSLAGYWWIQSCDQKIDLPISSDPGSVIVTKYLLFYSSCIPELVGTLMVGGYDRPFASIKVGFTSRFFQWTPPRFFQLFTWTSYGKSVDTKGKSALK